MFRKSLADLNEYSSNAVTVGVCMGDVVIAPPSWANDFVLFFQFWERIANAIGWLKCCNNNMVKVNEMKTKVKVYGSTSRNTTVNFDNEILDRVYQYQNLGNLVKSVKKCN